MRVIIWNIEGKSPIEYKGKLLWQEVRCDGLCLASKVLDGLLWNLQAGEQDCIYTFLHFEGKEVSVQQ